MWRNFTTFIAIYILTDNPEPYHHHYNPFYIKILAMKLNPPHMHA